MPIPSRGWGKETRWQDVNFTSEEGFIHWDTDPTQVPRRFGVQGVLTLTDTAANQGGFQCVPGIHRRIDEFLASQPPGQEPRRPDVTSLKIEPIPGKAGDLLIWNRLLLHGNGHNVSDRPRLAQYIAMSRAREEDEELRERRIRMWRERLHPEGRAFPGDPRRLEELHGTTADLTPLGRRLLGLERWEAAVGAATT